MHHRASTQVKRPIYGARIGRPLASRAGTKRARCTSRLHAVRSNRSNPLDPVTSHRSGNPRASISKVKATVPCSPARTDSAGKSSSVTQDPGGVLGCSGLGYGPGLSAAGGGVRTTVTGAGLCTRAEGAGPDRPTNCRRAPINCVMLWLVRQSAMDSTPKRNSVRPMMRSRTVRRRPSPFPVMAGPDCSAVVGASSTSTAHQKH